MYLDAMEDSRGEDATRFLLVRRDDERTSHLPYVHMLVVENNTYKTNSQLIKEVPLSAWNEKVLEMGSQHS